MQINGSVPAQASPAVPRDSQEVTVGADSSRPNIGAGATDSVQISDAGRAKAANVGVSLSPGRAAELRQAILDGKLDSVEVLANTASQILARGDA